MLSRLRADIFKFSNITTTTTFKKMTTNSKTSSNINIDIQASNGSNPFTKVYKLRVGNVGKFTKKNELEKIFKESGLSETSFRSVKKSPTLDFAIMSFESEQQMNSTRALLEAMKHPKTKETYSVSEFESRAFQRDDFEEQDLNGQKRKHKHNGKDTNSESGSESRSSDPIDAIIPLRNKTYADQLKWKQKDMVKALKKIKRETQRFEIKVCNRKKETLPFWLQDDYLKRDLDYAAIKTKRQKVDSGQLSAEDANLPEFNTGEIQSCCCPIDKIESSPKLEGYRNKCEFTIGLDSDRKVAIGFRAGKFKDKVLDLIRPTEELKHVSKLMRDICAICETVVASSSFSVYDVIERTGVWRQLSIRTSRTEIMLIFQLHRGHAADEKQLESEIASLKDLFLEKTFEDKMVVSVNIIFYDGSSVQENAQPDITFGQSYITETLNGMRYRISTDAFFQTNTDGAELLYNKIGSKIKKALAERPKADKDSSCEKIILLDICCGTGTIGLSLAHTVQHVIGVDNNASSIKDARINAELNGVSNALFVTANAEHVLGKLLLNEGKRYNRTHKMEEDNKRVEEMDAIEKENFDKINELLKGCISSGCSLVAVVDPPRAGLHPSVIRALRSANRLESIVYVSCNPSGSFIEDARQLCSTTNEKRRPGVSFYPVESSPVDMFPHTKHTELVTLFKRLQGLETNAGDAEINASTKLEN